MVCMNVGRRWTDVDTDVDGGEQAAWMCHVVFREVNIVSLESPGV